eukprot:1186767-Prorocentrum_minimum.AAC.5
MVFLCADRSVHFHAKFGAYHKIRTPRQGRDLAYAPNTCDMVIVGSTSDIYRVNLEQEEFGSHYPETGCGCDVGIQQGRFMSPLQSSSPGINCCGFREICILVVRLYCFGSGVWDDYFTLGLDTDTAQLTVKTLSSHLITGEFNSPPNSLQAPYVRAEPYFTPCTRLAGYRRRGWRAGVLRPALADTGRATGA